ncbi:MAG: heme lyase NrfEFG subunit NrfE, partial [Thioclava sp.]
MTPELGHFALALALALALVQSTIPLLGAARGNLLWMRSSRSTAFGQVVFVGLAFAALMRAFVVSDFTVLNVANNSHSLKPMIFKVAAT